MKKDFGYTTTLYYFHICWTYIKHFNLSLLPIFYLKKYALYIWLTQTVFIYRKVHFLYEAIKNWTVTVIISTWKTEAPANDINIMFFYIRAVIKFLLNFSALIRIHNLYKLKFGKFVGNYIWSLQTYISYVEKHDVPFSH